ncbi:MAG: tetraacyldisaccharide 4'-kinase [Henriciella sp.]|nr:tetraacyldisaccharide 4'-kinase [Henriciella sp.]
MREPKFWAADLDPWSRAAAPLTRTLLTPLSWLYAYATARKLRTGTPLSVSATVICVGNLTAGGVGKSPVVDFLRDHLSDLTGQRVATLSRGYGGTLKGPLQVDAKRHTAAEVGDEPLMLAQNGESWIGADRGRAGEAMSEAGVEIIIMDDGFQNPSLAKDFSFLVVDAKSRFGNGHVIPKGPLREPVSQGLKRADAIILIGDGERPVELAETSLPLLRATIEPVQAPPPGAYVAFAGIGRPEKLFDSLNALGADVRDAVPFPDHHVYRAADLNYLRRLAEDNQARLITTEKDYVRLSSEVRADMLTLPVQTVFEDPTALDRLLTPVVKPRS